MQITVERVLSDDIVATLYPTYVDAWEPLLVHAAARHVLTADEFAAEMTDPRIEKYVVWDEASHTVLALTTLTTDMSAIPWINALYFEARYPDAADRSALFYLGYTLVERHHRRSSALLVMADRINRRVMDAGGVVGFDICDFNNEHGIGRRVARLFSASNKIEALDTQSYYAADYRGASAPRTNRYSGGANRLQPVSGPRQSYSIATLADRPDFAAEIPELLASRWATFMLAGHPGHEVDLDELLLGIPEKQVLLISEDDVLSGAGLSVPLRWDGTIEDLPGGWDDAITRSADLLEHGQLANAMCALSITIAPDATGKSLAADVMTAMNRVAGAAGADSLIVPVRPSRKGDYPLIPMERYLTWRSPKGESFDPWLRLHQRLGGQILGIADVSMTVTGTVKEWEAWLDQELPDDGDYVITGGLAPLRIDTAADLGTYREPNVWVRHQPTR